MTDPTMATNTEPVEYLDPSGPSFSSKTIEKFEIISNFLEGYSFPLFLTIFLVYTVM